MTVAGHDPFTSPHLYRVQDSRQAKLVGIYHIDELIPDDLLQVFTPGGRELLLHQVVVSAHDKDGRVGGSSLCAEEGDDGEGTSVMGIGIKRP